MLDLHLEESSSVCWFVRLMAVLRLICSHSDIVYVGGGVGGAAMQGNYLGKGYIISLSDLIDDEGPTPI